MNIKKVDISQIKYTPIEGEIAKDAKTGEYMVWNEGQWQTVKLEGGGVELGLYDMNKQIISQLPYLEDFEKAMDDIWTLYETYHNKYFMLYGKEISYFTVFKIKEHIAFGREVVDVIQNIGTVKAIDLTELADAIEVWVIYNDEPTCLYLFPYDMGVVQVGE